MSATKTRAVALEVVIPGQPVPASRPRVTHARGVYYHKRYEQWLESAKWLARDAGVKAFGSAPRWVSSVTVRVEFYGANDQADIDNLLKASLDALQPDVIANDRQVKSVFAFRHPASGLIGPRTVITVIPLDPFEAGGGG